MPTLKPLDEEAIVKAASETHAIVVAEEHLAHGGLGSRVAQVVAREKPVPMEFVNLGDRYALSGKPEELLQRYGLTAKDIENAVRAVVKRK
jgi:transketolase